MGTRVIVGECLQALRELPDQSVNMCVTSPPYFGLRDYGHEGQIGMEATPEAFTASLVAVFREVHRVLRDDGTLWVNLGDTYQSGRGQPTQPDLKGGAARRGFKRPQDGRLPGLKSKDLIGIPWRVAFALQADGWYLRQDIIWSKPNPMPESVQDRCTKAHEYLFLLSKGPRYHFDAKAISEESVGQNVHDVTGGGYEPPGQPAHPGSRKNSFARGTKDCGGVTGGKPQFRPDRDPVAYEGRRNRRSVWTVATQPYKEAHFATYPPGLIEPCILAGCPVGGTVLDPFGGAGTTGMVADRLGRNAILIELNPEYADMARRRLTADAGMFAEVGG